MRFVGRLPNTAEPLTYKLFDSATIMDTSVYVSYTLKRLPMEEGAKLFLYLIFNKVSQPVMVGYMGELALLSLSLLLIYF